MRKAFFDTILEVGKQDEKLVVLVGDISHFGLQPFAKACPGRFYNVGILEPTIVSMAAGLAHSGLYPVAHTITPFLIERSFEQIKMDFCYQELGGTLISVGSAFDYSGLGCSHHCYDDLSLVKSLPNTEVIYPAMPNEFNLLFKETYKNGKLTYFRLPSLTHDIEIADDQIRVGKAIVIKEGKDVTIATTGTQLKTVMQSVPVLLKMNIDAEVVYYPTIKPFDNGCIINSVAKTQKVVVIEEHSKYGGLSDEILRATCNLGNIRYSFINIPDKFQRGYGSYQDHLESLGFTSERVVKESLSILLPMM